MTCPAFAASGPAAIAEALRAVDCMAGAATASAFARIFGSAGPLTAALTIVLTLYVALFALALLTGRGGLGVAALTPRMLTLGLALTFATSWIAYSQIVWSLFAAGPDWLAATILGIKGSAVQAFAERLDLLFGAIAEAAEAARQSAGDRKGLQPGDLLDLSALLLLLGSVGVLLTSRIALAALLAVGPVFIILALFAGTRGLFEGWLKAALMFALVPLFSVLIGVGAVALLDPVVGALAGGTVDFGQAAAVFIAATVHCALMAMALKLVWALTSGWRLPATPMPAATPAAAAPAAPGAAPATLVAHAAAPVQDARLRALLAAVAAPPAAAAPMVAPEIRRHVQAPMAAVAAAPAAPASRARAIGRTLQRAAPAPKEMV